MARGPIRPGHVPEARSDGRSDGRGGAPAPWAPGPGGARGAGRSGAGPPAVARLVLACVGLAALSLLLPSTPTYDPWAWIVWGREVLHLDLNTVDGPSWKPLPVLFTTTFSAAGAAAPALWLVVARAGAVLGLAMAFRLASRLAGPLAGAVAALGVGLSTGWLRNAALGNSEGLLVGLGLLAVERHLDGRRDHALVLATGAALLRPEAWPFLGLYAAWLWLAEPRRRRLVIVALALVPLLWLGPELWGSGDALRAASRAQEPTALSPAFADRPALEILRLAALLVLPPLGAGAVAAVILAARDRRAARDARAAHDGHGRRSGGAILLLAGGAVAWIALVAVMTQAGYAGNQRYLVLPGAVLSVVGAAGLVRLGRALAETAPGRTLAASTRRPAPAARAPARSAIALLLVAASVGPFAVARVDRLESQLELVSEDVAINRDLAAAVDAAGGPGPLLACGRPYTGPYQVPALAWELRIHTGRVGLEPRPPGVVFRRRAATSRFGLPRPRDRFRRVARAGAIDVLASCRGRPGGGASSRARAIVRRESRR